jgi:hypothetical protein
MSPPRSSVWPAQVSPRPSSLSIVTIEEGPGAPRSRLPTSRNIARGVHQIVAIGDDAGADAYSATSLAADLAAVTAAGKHYMAVVFPGFSWHNFQGGDSNQVPRRGGAFYWRQVWNAVDAGATMLKTAMFDEVDEGTAMFKLAPTAANLPTGAALVPLDADGRALPSDFYLPVGGAATVLLRGDLPMSPGLPVTP